MVVYKKVFVLYYMYLHNIMKQTHRHNQGIIWEIVVIIVALLILKFAFDIDVLAWFKSPQFTAALEYLKEIINTLKESIQSVF